MSEPVPFTDSSQQPTFSKKRGWKKCSSCQQFSPPAAKICKFDDCKAVFPARTFDWSAIERMGSTNPSHQRELLEKRANILYKKHKWDVVIFYYHPHGVGDTISVYGTPGNAAKFLGLCDSKEKMPPAGKRAVDLFERFIDHEISDSGTATSSATTSVSSSTLSSISTATHSITINSTCVTLSTNLPPSQASSIAITANPATGTLSTILPPSLASSTAITSNSATSALSTNLSPSHAFSTAIPTNSATSALSTNLPPSHASSTAITTNSATVRTPTNLPPSHASFTAPTLNPVLSSSFHISTSPPAADINSISAPIQGATTASLSSPAVSSNSNYLSTPLPSTSVGSGKNVQAQSSSVISTNVTVHPSSTHTPVTTSSSSAAVQRAETKLVAYVENNTVQALGVPFELRKVIHGKPIPKAVSVFKCSIQVSNCSRKRR